MALQIRIHVDEDAVVIVGLDSNTGLPREKEYLAGEARIGSNLRSMTMSHSSMEPIPASFCS